MRLLIHMKGEEITLDASFLRLTARLTWIDVQDNGLQLICKIPQETVASENCPTL